MQIFSGGYNYSVACLSLLPYILSAFVVYNSTSTVIDFDFHCPVSALTGCEKSNKRHFRQSTEGV